MGRGLFSRCRRWFSSYGLGLGLSSNPINQLLNIKNLYIKLPKGSEREFAVQKLDLDLLSGETLCIVGESGSGKSLTARSVMGLLPAPHVCVDRGSIDFLGEEITSINDERLRDQR